MKTNKLIVFIILVSILSSCKLKKVVTVNDYYPPTPGKMVVYSSGQQIPSNVIRIGSISVGEGGFTPTKKCTYEACLTVIEDEAKKAGADFVYIVKVREPDFWSGTCYHITAEFYRYQNK